MKFKVGDMVAVNPSAGDIARDWIKEAPLGLGIIERISGSSPYPILVKAIFGNRWGCPFKEEELIFVSRDEKKV